MKNDSDTAPEKAKLTNEEHRRFLEVCPKVERFIVDAGVQFIKFWLEVGDEEQKRRFEARIDDPLRQWKLSTMDLPSRSKWYAYSRARDQMLEATDTEHAPWHIVRSDDKRRARLNFIAHFLSLIPYKDVRHEKVELPKRSKKDAYDDVASIANRRFVPEILCLGAWWLIRKNRAPRALEPKPRSRSASSRRSRFPKAWLQGRVSPMGDTCCGLAGDAGFIGRKVQCLQSLIFGNTFRAKPRYPTETLFRLVPFASQNMVLSTSSCCLDGFASRKLIRSRQVNIPVSIHELIIIQNGPCNS
jgi:Polyphosphate kinase 2 (PPK2)